jgi:hypothetical protein
MTYIGRISPKDNIISNCRVTISKIYSLKNINIQDMDKFSNSVTSCTQFGRYLFNMTPPVQVFVNM